MAIDQFNNRRYQTSRDDPSTNNNATGGVSSSLSILHDFTPVDNCLQSVLNNKVELSREFEENYEEWLECEVGGVCRGGVCRGGVCRGVMRLVVCVVVVCVVVL